MRIENPLIFALIPFRPFIMTGAVELESYAMVASDLGCGWGMGGWENGRKGGGRRAGARW